MSKDQEKSALDNFNFGGGNNEDYLLQMAYGRLAELRNTLSAQWKVEPKSIYLLIFFVDVDGVEKLSGEFRSKENKELFEPFKL